MPQQNTCRSKKKKRTPHSIPSRYETVLSTTPGVGKGFGKSSTRFEDHRNVHDLPGPGAYHRPGSITKSTETEGAMSYSRKGYGAIVSKTERFGREREEDELPPGPGYYTIETTILSSAQDFSVGGTAAFKCAPRPVTAGPFAGKDIPSPGQYDLCRTYTPRYKKSMRSSAFASETQRGWVIRNEAPAPGAYDVPAQTRWASAAGASSAFRSASQRGADLVPRSRLGTPAPGQYDGMSKPIKPKNETVHPSPMFANTGLDRFGKPYLKRTLQEETPAPGHYGAIPVDPISRAAAVSAFKTSVRKSMARARELPGPAYYSPTKVAEKRSFHLNAGTHWV
ncbi:O6-methylguanine-induced apoptosis 2 [Hondaea fermentalgiana]|uniref:O6-methylguanine-induced apoptosis 2 n=1 Tax=Hondaea fermentalgiana TaxID=2315210 RepID=A0A2R5GMC0_9STRA|nr:O6-methylguanine-induced apoptosis 2 [Hondaea fermentalgiana]|eukprot:GBG32027.1 O6-methylguanine-induced apoptosis 2 [Hondaea fermentalgiana]